MKKLLTGLLILMLVGTVFTGAVFAYGSHSKMGKSNGHYNYNGDDSGYGNGYLRVELSQEQIDQIADLRNDFYNETEELRDQFRDLKRELRDLEFRGASNAEIGEIEDKIETVLIKMDEKRLENQEKIKSVMNEEQLKIIEENRLNYEEGFQGRFNDNFGPKSDDNYGNRDRHSMFNSGFGHGMMRGFFSGSRHHGFNGRRNFEDRNLGYGPGWCH